MTPTEAKAQGSALTRLCGTRMSILYTALDMTTTQPGEIWECGVFRGGSSLAMKGHMMERGSNRVMRLFDTFTGIPTSGVHDIHPVGAFNETDAAAVRALMQEWPDVWVHQGFIPDTFAGLEESRISVAHIDVDQYQAVLDCLAFIYPRTLAGGYIVLDDYNCPGCPGAHRAVGEFFGDKPEVMAITHGTPQVYYVKVAEPISP